MEITIRLRKELVDRARRSAEPMGKTLEDFIIEKIEHLANSDDCESWTREFLQLSGRAHSGGWKFNRDEVHERD